MFLTTGIIPRRRKAPELVALIDLCRSREKLALSLRPKPMWARSWTLETLAGVAPSVYQTRTPVDWIERRRCLCEGLRQQAEALTGNEPNLDAEIARIKSELPSEEDMLRIGQV